MARTRQHSQSALLHLPRVLQQEEGNRKRRRRKKKDQGQGNEGWICQVPHQKRKVPRKVTEAHQTSPPKKKEEEVDGWDEKGRGRIRMEHFTNNDGGKGRGEKEKEEYEGGQERGTLHICRQIMMRIFSLSLPPPPAETIGGKVV